MGRAGTPSHVAGWKSTVKLADGISSIDKRPAGLGRPGTAHGLGARSRLPTSCCRGGVVLLALIERANITGPVGTQTPKFNSHRT